MKKLISVLVASTIFIIILLGTYWAHVTYVKVNVLLYSAITDGVLATISAYAILLKWRRFNILNSFEKFLTPNLPPSRGIFDGDNS